MAEILIEYLRPFREKRKHLEEKKEERVIGPWKESLRRARQNAEAAIDDVKEILHILHCTGEIKK